MNQPTPAGRRPRLSAIREFIRHESFAGVLLVCAGALAMILDNSALSRHYDALLGTPMTVRIGTFSIDKPLLLWINDGLMALFFFMVGLEIKREFREGELSSFDKAILPAIAAVGGMTVPAAIYAALNWGNAETLRGWAIPAATDIAFALGVLSLLGKRVPIALKVFLLAIAVLDDLGAIVVIAIFYTQKLSLISLVIAAAGLTVLLIMNLRGVSRPTPYVLLGVVIWAAVLKSGVHATVAGVLIALTIPLRDSEEPERSPLKELEHAIHPSVAYVILPLFAFANAGVSLEGVKLSSLLEPVPLGIALGLFLGKQIGIFLATWLACASGLCRKPDGATWLQIYGVAIICGIGFTMSLFIGGLAFEPGKYDAAVRLGVLAGSIVSTVVGLIFLRAVSRAPARDENEEA
jgi:NhaA family Na+:H+ antiporter